MKYLSILIRVICVIMCIIMSTSCKSTEYSGKNELNTDTTKNHNIGINKLDANSRVVLSRAESNAPGKILDLVIMFSEDISDEELNKFREENIKIISKIGKIVTAQATPLDIKKIIYHDKIEKIEINKHKQIK